MRARDRQNQERLLAATNLADNPDVNPPDVDTRLAELREAITGQKTPPPAMGWSMSNNRSAKRLDALEPVVAQAMVKIDSFADVLRTGLADFSTRFDLLNAQRQFDLTAVQVERTRNDLQDAKDLLQDAALTQLAAQDQLTATTDAAQSAAIEQNRLATVALAARQTATEQKLAANELTLKALQASDAAQTATQQQQATALSALQAQQLADERNIETDRQLAVAAQARADQALAAATAAQAAANTAQADAQAAKTAAATASAAATTNAANLATQTARVDAAVANVATLQTNVATAQATANAAQAAVTALADKGQVMLGIVTPASVGVLGVGGTLTVAITFPKPFADAQYAESFTRVSGMSAVMGLSVTNKTATGCTLVLTNNGALSLSVPAGTVDAVFTHK
jgi:chromosome segregation ATPase